MDTKASPFKKHTLSECFGSGFLARITAALTQPFQSPSLRLYTDTHWENVRIFASDTPVEETFLSGSRSLSSVDADIELFIHGYANLPPFEPGLEGSEPFTHCEGVSLSPDSEAYSQNAMGSYLGPGGWDGTNFNVDTTQFAVPATDSEGAPALVLISIQDNWQPGHRRAVKILVARTPEHVNIFADQSPSGYGPYPVRQFVAELEKAIDIKAFFERKPEAAPRPSRP